MGPAEIHALRRAWVLREQRLDYRAGVVASLIANAHRDQDARPSPFLPEDFFPSLAELRPEPTEDELLARALAAFGLPGA